MIIYHYDNNEIEVPDNWIYKSFDRSKLGHCLHTAQREYIKDSGLSRRISTSNISHGLWTYKDKNDRIIGYCKLHFENYALPGSAIDYHYSKIEFWHKKFSSFKGFTNGSRIVL